MTNDNGELMACPCGGKGWIRVDVKYDTHIEEGELCCFSCGKPYSNTRPDSRDEGLIADVSRLISGLQESGFMTDKMIVDVLSRCKTTLSQASGSGENVENSIESYKQEIKDLQEYIANLTSVGSPAMPNHIKCCNNPECGKINSGIDECIKPLIAVLNAGGFKTIASCCGHRNRMGSIVMDNKVELLITDFDTAREIEKHFADIHGKHKPAKPKAEDEEYSKKICPNCEGAGSLSGGTTLNPETPYNCPLCEGMGFVLAVMGGSNE